MGLLGSLLGSRGMSQRGLLVLHSRLGLRLGLPLPLRVLDLGVLGLLLLLNVLQLRALVVLQWHPPI